MKNRNNRIMASLSYHLQVSDTSLRGLHLSFTGTILPHTPSEIPAFRDPRIDKTASSFSSGFIKEL